MSGHEERPEPAGVSELQTFLPLPNFVHSLAVLDTARLGKQRLECGQLLAAHACLLAGRPVVGWRNHPAMRMWLGHSAALAVYQTLCHWEWTARGYNNSILIPTYGRDGLPNPDFRHPELLAPSMREATLPPWLGREDVHASHRARLLHKAPDHYGQFGWTEQPRTDEEGYVWPVTRETR